ncbi:MAG: cyclic nucleotide-binding domain-containing protein [Acidobacteriota bacterium]
MTEPSVRDLISRHPFLQGMDEKYLDYLAGCGRRVRLPAGEKIFKEGGPADTFYLVLQGRIAIQTPIPGKGPLTIRTVEAGDIAGWSWIFPPYRTYFDAVAVEETEAVQFDGACLRAQCQQDREFGYELVKRFAEVMRDRLRSTHLQLLDMYRVPQT